MPTALQSFNRLVLLTSTAVYFLILVGGIVRNTSSGMGCPDWPKCFGSYVPPTSEDGLPADYQGFYLESRLAKTDRLVNTLKRFGFHKTAEKIENDPYLEREERFDATTAWIEYINRLIGVVIGFLVLLTTYKSFKFWKTKKLITIVAVLGLVLILFQGWFGSLVVATNLIPAFVSVHMVLAFLQILLLMYLIFLSSSHSQHPETPVWVRSWVTALFVLFIPQVLLGTQVRHIVDLAVFEGYGRADWLLNIDWKFYFHRSYSLVFLISLLILFVRIRMLHVSGVLMKFISWCLVLVIFESVSGAVMYYFNFPFGLQPLHLLLASLIFGFLFYLTLVSRVQIVK